jgi:uncharacterized Fe-S cluster-containing protein
MTQIKVADLPGLNCGVCGYRTCEELAVRLETEPEMIKRCIHLSENELSVATESQKSFNAPGQRSRGKNASPSSIPGTAVPGHLGEACSSCGTCGINAPVKDVPRSDWRDSLGREFDFYLEHFPEEPGPREIILPHNPMITREMNIQPGEVLIGRPLGMSCGCPITHCGIAQNVDHRTGVLSWCVTGPLQPRQQGYKDLGYYIAEGYEGLIQQARCEIKIGMRYFFQPRMCMLQWRHSGLVNYLNRTPQGLQVRVEGLWIG